MAETQKTDPTQGMSQDGIVQKGGLWDKVMQMHAAQSFMQNAQNGATAGAPQNPMMGLMGFMQLMNIFGSSNANGAPSDAQANTEQKAKDAQQKTANPSQAGGSPVMGLMKVLKAIAGGGE